MSNTYNALIHAKQDGTGEEVANNKTGGDGSSYAPVTSIATPENGDTASKAYAVGDHFIRDSAFCTAISAIAQGGSFTLNTNYTAGDVGSTLTELNSKIPCEEWHTLNAYVRYKIQAGFCVVEHQTQNTGGSPATYGALPVDYRPSYGFNTCVYNDGTNYCNVGIAMDGGITETSNTSVGRAILIFPVN